MRAFSAVGAGVRHTAYVAAQALLIAAIIGALAFAAATYFGGAPGGAKSVFAARSGAWIALNQTTRLSVTGDNTATFSIGQNKTSTPWVRVNCTVNGALAYSQLLGYFPSYPYGQTFTFDSNTLQWNYDKNALECTALLEYKDAKGNERVMADTTFVVNP